MASNNPPTIPPPGPVPQTAATTTPTGIPYPPYNFNSATYQEYYANYMKYMQYYASNMYANYPSAYPPPPPNIYSKPPPPTITTTAQAPPPPPPPAPIQTPTPPEPQKPIKFEIKIKQQAEEVVEAPAPEVQKKSRFDVTTPNIAKHQNLYAQYQQKQQIMIQQQQLKQAKQHKAVAQAAAIAQQKITTAPAKAKSESDVVFDINKWPMSLKNYCSKVYQHFAGSSQVSEQLVTNYLQNRITQAFRVKADLAINWDAEKIPDVNTVRQLGSIKIDVDAEKKVTQQQQQQSAKRKSKSPSSKSESDEDSDRDDNVRQKDVFSAKKKFKKEEKSREVHQIASRINFKRTIANDAADKRKSASDGEDSDVDMDDESDEEFKPLSKRITSEKKLSKAKNR